MILIKKLKEILSSAAEMLKPIVNREITVNEYLLADIVGAKTANVVFENSKNLENLKGESDINFMWKLKKKLFPNVKDPPSAVLGKKGNLICNKNGIMNRFH